MGVNYACPEWKGDEIFDLGETRRVISGVPCEHTFREPNNCCGYNSQALSIANETDVWGFFQTSRYFLPETRSWYRFKNGKSQPDLSGFTSIHMRFGDYLELEHVYPELTAEYYRQAIELLGATKLAVFSDDPVLARKKMRTLSDCECIFFAYRSEFDDLQSIASCDSHIISNSSFSWWGAWLSKNEKAPIICSKLWFATDWSTQNEDIYPDTWRSI